MFQNMNSFLCCRLVTIFRTESASKIVLLFNPFIHNFIKCQFEHIYNGNKFWQKNYVFRKVKSLILFGNSI